jgi:MOSC domain-containing protein YiiM
MKGKIISLNISEKKGVKKQPVDTVQLQTNYGIAGDAHASSSWHRQVSLLAIESINKIIAKGLNVKPGDFAENITTEGIDIPNLRIGSKLTLGQSIQLEITQLGKFCHHHCAIYEQAGDCVMPTEGVFARVLNGGMLKIGDSVVSE